LQYFVVREIEWPSVSREDRSVEPLVSVLKPRRAGIVEVGERALFELCLRSSLRIEPLTPEFVEAAGSFGYVLDSQIAF
jgi:hypothetical protein